MGLTVLACQGAKKYTEHTFFKYFWGKMAKFRHFLGRTTLAIVSLLISLGILLLFVLIYLESQLPPVAELRDMHMQVPTRIYDKDHQLIAQYGYKRRIPVAIDQIPKPLIDAVLATEDARYYSHPGVDFIGIARAAVAVVSSGRKVQGASTITMQVARNFFLTRKKTYGRKINEILLAIKIDRALSKDKVLELYLNKIYFGNRAYGVAAAAQVYYGVSLQALTLPQMAMIAGLPQAPSRTNPIANPSQALIRRNHVLERMRDVGYINQAQYQDAIKSPVTAKYHRQHIAVDARYFAQWVHQDLLQQYGKQLDEMGFQVVTTLDSHLQAAANQALQDGLDAYSQRHGYYGPIQHLNINSSASVDTDTVILNKDTAAQSDGINVLAKIQPVNDIKPALVTVVEQQSVAIEFADQTTASVPWEGMSWAAPALKQGFVGSKPKQASDILKVGDVIWVRSHDNHWWLTQVPKVQGAIVSMDPKSGAVKAMAGGYDYRLSNFNRVTQAQRQAGSSFKPFIYSAAIAKGYTLASIVNDAPVVMKDSGENALWRPQNDNLTFNGPTRLRVGLTQSRNLVSIRLLQGITVPFALNYLHRFGFSPDSLPNTLSLALGSASESPLSIASGYAVFANGGYRIHPYGISSIRNAFTHQVVETTPAMACMACVTPSADPQIERPKVLAPQVITPQNAYLITQALRGVIQSGTGRQAKALHRSDLAGKTGTTNKQVDAWFSGFNSDVVTTVWVGFDDLASLHEYGSKAALPIWIDYMREALAKTPLATMPEPQGLLQVRIDPANGLLAHPGQKKAIFETFRQAYAPTQYSPDQTTVAFGSSNESPSAEQPLF